MVNHEPSPSRSRFYNSSHEGNASRGRRTRQPWGVNSEFDDINTSKSQVVGEERSSL